MTMVALAHLIAGVVVIAGLTLAVSLVTQPAGSGEPAVSRVAVLRLMLAVMSLLLLVALLLGAVGIANRPWAFYLVCIGLSAGCVAIGGQRQALLRATRLARLVAAGRHRRLAATSLVVTLALVVTGLVVSERATHHADRPDVALAIGAHDGASEVTVTRAGDTGSVMYLAVLRGGRQSWRSAQLPRLGSALRITIPETATASGATVNLIRDEAVIRTVTLP